MKEFLKNGDTVEIEGFGKFKVVECKKKAGRNTRTGKKLSLLRKLSTLSRPSLYKILSTSCQRKLSI